MKPTMGGGRYPITWDLSDLGHRSNLKERSARVPSQMLYANEGQRALSSLQIYSLPGPISMLLGARLNFRCPIPATPAAPFNASAH
jgi:hypothetical protein